MNKKLGFNHTDATDLAFTLVELLTCVAIMSVLMTIVIPKIQYTRIRAGLAQISIETSIVSSALTNYYLDYSAFPPTNIFLSFSKQIHEVSQLTTPIGYLTKVPHSPWEGRTSLLDDTRNPGNNEWKTQGNYNLMNKNLFYFESGLSIHQPGWAFSSGGPVTIFINANTKNWYAPTNGLLSWGGFYTDSLGYSNCR